MSISRRSLTRGSLTRRESHLVDTVAIQQAETIAAAFERADTEGDGIITFSELAQVFRQLGPWTDEDLRVVFEAADRLGDGVIDYEEFSEWLMAEWGDGGEQAAGAMANLPSENLNAPQGTGDEFHLFAIRHGKPEPWDRAKYPDETVRDPGLSADGKLQAQKLSAFLKKEVGSFHVLIVSPMARALDTAAPLAQVGPKYIQHAICHAQFCEHGSKPSDFHPVKIAAAQPQLFGSAATHKVDFVAFDSPADRHDVQSRANDCAEWLRKESKQWPSGAVIGIVSHQTFLDCLLQVFVLGDDSQWEYGWPKFKLEKSAFTEISVKDGKIKPVRQNHCDHLKA